MTNPSFAFQDDWRDFLEWVQSRYPGLRNEPEAIERLAALLVERDRRLEDFLNRQVRNIVSLVVWNSADKDLSATSDTTITATDSTPLEAQVTKAHTQSYIHLEGGLQGRILGVGSGLWRLRWEATNLADSTVYGPTTFESIRIDNADDHPAKVWGATRGLLGAPPGPYKVRLRYYTTAAGAFLRWRSNTYGHLRLIEVPEPSG